MVSFMKELTKQRILAPLVSVLPMALYIVISIMVAILLMLADVLTGGGLEERLPNENGILATLSDPFFMAIGAAVGCLLVRRRNGITLRSALKFQEFDWMVPLMLIIFNWGAGELCDHFGGLLMSQFMTVKPNPDVGITWLTILDAVLLAPILEEIIFRYVGTEAPRGAYRMSVICLCSGLFFAVVHLYNIQGFFNVLIGGVCASYVYCKTGNLLYTILEHAIHNALCFLPLHSVTLFGVPLYYERGGFVLGGWWWLLFNAVLVAVAVIWYIKVFRKNYTTAGYFEVNTETGRPVKETGNYQTQKI